MSKPNKNNDINILNNSIKIIYKKIDNSKVDGCDLCHSFPCCPDHCCDWDTCECGDCEYCIKSHNNEEKINDDINEVIDPAVDSIF